MGGTSEDLLEETVAEGAAQAWQAITLSLMAIAYRLTSDLEEARRQAKLAQEIGARFQDRAVQALGLQLEGRIPGGVGPSGRGHGAQR